MLLLAGESNQKVGFLFTDTQIKLESFVEDISNLLNTYEVCCRRPRPHVRPCCLAQCVNHCYVGVHPCPATASTPAAELTS